MKDFFILTFLACLAVVICHDNIQQNTDNNSVGEIVCPDGSVCPDGTTCCETSAGNYGCCPEPNAVCCSDGVHCCREGYTCNKKSCTKQETTKISTLIPKIKSVVCPGGQSQCPDGSTCCKLPSGGYGCCPLSEAVCCSDGEHCCPHGYTCDVSAETCSKEEQTIPFFKKIAPVKETKCPDGSSCPDANTCCQLFSGGYGCCSYENAVCCSDKKHCCPEGTTCNVAEEKCNRGGKMITFFKKVATIKKITCPGGSKCDDGQTCCKTKDGSDACCPKPNAVCCDDHEHCCPHGYTCDTKARTCIKGAEITAIFTKIKPRSDNNIKN